MSRSVAEIEEELTLVQADLDLAEVELCYNELRRYNLLGEQHVAFVIEDAEKEYDQLGTLTTSTFCALTELGIDAQEFIDNLETTNHG